MLAHEPFEKLCALAAAGEISAADWPALEAHLDECAECRTAFRERKDVAFARAGDRAGREIPREAAREARLRRKILQRAAAAGARFTPEAIEASLPVQARSPRVRFWGPVRRPLAGFAAGALIAGAGVWMALRVVSPASAPAPPPVVTVRAPAPAGLALLEAEVSQDTAVQAEGALRQELRDARAETAQLEQQLQAAQSRASDLAGANSAANIEVGKLERQLNAAQSSESRAEAELAGLRGSWSDAAKRLDLSDADNSALRAKLATESASLKRETALLSHGRDIRDLISARNLHIIDVYDTNGAGKTSKSFGRVFYTEGRSLIFFAYDLPRSGAVPTKYEFTAWGKGDGSDAQARRLGIFYRDKKDLKRWVMEVTDPRALSQINSVFVTLEKTGHPAGSPKGKKLLSAFLGAPANHP